MIFFQNQQYDDAISYLTALESKDSTNLQLLGFLGYANHMNDNNSFSHDSNSQFALSYELLHLLQWLSRNDTDKLKMNQALENNQPGQPAYWQNQKTGTDYTVVPTKNVTVDGNQYCREYRSTANIAGKKQQVYGTACRQPDGTWQVAN